ncbi:MULTISPECIES: isoprenylcysteine carboxylmethyltransferase family protein [Mycobacterium]|uniref:methyltransferase family protein n=1 Tax=Mycobacterium sp. 20KCMC460 TaxID=2903536 RepID=UPI001EEFBC04|nr:MULTISPECIES: methyltransferase [Mycobacterium]
MRHPMYVGNLILMLGLPLALGSYWGLVLYVPLLAVLVLRTLDEERALAADLPGYRDYQQRVRYRLVPNIW